MATPVVITPASTTANSSAVSTQTNNTTTAAGTNSATQSSSQNNQPTTPTSTSTTAAAATPTNPSSFNPSSVTTAATTALVQNPLDAYPTYTYNWSLWWIDVNDFNAVVDGGLDSARDFTMGQNSYVVACDGGIYPTQRLPSQEGLNYQIQEVEMDCQMSLNSKDSGSNAVSGKMKIVEPYGCTFIDTLVYWAISSSTSSTSYENYLTRPYMLQLDFTGFDESGNPIDSSLSYLRKRFLIRLTNMTLDFGSSGAEYTLDFAPYGHKAYGKVSGNTPKLFSVQGKTVQDVFNDYKTQLNQYWITQSTLNGIPYSDSVDFKIDPAIAASSINYSRQMPLTQANPNSPGLDLSTSTFQIPGGMSVLKAIERILIQSSFMLDQVGANLQAQGLTTATADTTQLQGSLAQVFNRYKVSMSSRITATKSDGSKTDGQFDHVRNKWPSQYTYSIQQFTVTNPTSPTLPFYYDPSPLIVKDYNYLYTGRNTSVINFKLHFDTTYYTSMLAFPSVQSSADAMSNTVLDDADAVQGTVLLTPQYVAQSGLLGQIGKTPNPQPLTVELVNTDRTATHGFNVGLNPGAQQMAMAFKSMYSSPMVGGSGITVEMEIIGDPTLIKQDDVLYAGDPTQINDYTNWGTVSQSTFSSKYGHLRMDAGGPLVCQVTLNSPLDIDTDWLGGNQGLVTPQAGTYPSLFSGLYEIISIKNKFAKGAFTQVLTMQRNIQSSVLQSSTFQSSQATLRSSTASNSVVSQLLNQMAAAVAAGDKDKAAQIQQQIVNYDSSRK